MISIALLIIAAKSSHLAYCIFQLAANQNAIKRRHACLESRACIPTRARYVLVPLYQEERIADQCVRLFTEHFCISRGERVVFITHATDANTTKVVASAIQKVGSIGVIHHISKSRSPVKAEQLEDALLVLSPHLDALISVYDCDSLPDRRAHAHIETYVRDEPALNDACFQQCSFYPVSNRIDDIEQLLSIGRSIYSLHYHLTSEVTTMRRCERSAAFRMAMQLIGHGEHFSFRTLAGAGGFTPPSCDSRLGYNLSFRDVPIVLIPIPDVATTPRKIRDIYKQGLRWYSGCELYWRERQSVTRTFAAYLMCWLTFYNNLHWFFFPLVIAAASLSVIVSADFTGILGLAVLAILLFARHLFLRSGYILLLNQTRILDKLQYLPSVFKWAGPFFGAFVIMRLIWCIPPWHYYLLLLSRRIVAPGSTFKDEHIQV